MKSDCASCGHRIDSSARLCPFCGADPETGRKADTSRILEKHFPPRPDLPAHERALEFLRARQGIVLTVLVLGAALLAIGLHQMITRRTLAQSNAAAGVPLTELADISRRPQEPPVVPMPELEFTGEGDPRRVRTLLLEPGAVAPPTPTPSPLASPGLPAREAAAPARPAVVTTTVQ
jgi:hypothetical protein